MSSRKKDTFIQEYLYIEEMPPLPLKHDKAKIDQIDQTDRGVFVIDLFDEKEEDR